jgi:hypothetical protein
MIDNCLFMLLFSGVCVEMSSWNDEKSLMVGSVDDVCGNVGDETRLVAAVALELRSGSNAA